KLETLRCAVPDRVWLLGARLLPWARTSLRTGQWRHDRQRALLPCLAGRARSAPSVAGRAARGVRVRAPAARCEWPAARSPLRRRRRRAAHPSFALLLAGRALLAAGIV